MDYYSAVKRNEIGSFIETQMDLETVIQSEVSQKEKSKYHIILCRIWKNDTDELTCKTEIETQTQRTNVWIPKGEGHGGINGEIGTDIYTSLYKADN